MINLSAPIIFHAARTPDRLAMIYEDQRISYGDLRDRVLKMAGYLKKLGVQKNQVVCIFMKNSAAFIEIACAVSHLGAVFLPINFRLAQKEVEFIVDNSEAVLICVDAECQQVAAGIKNVVLIDSHMQHDSRHLSGHQEYPVAEDCQPGDLLRLMYTSGTTDRPKGVMLTYENYYWKCLDHISSLGVTERERLLVVGPLYHVGAFDIPGMAVFNVGGMMYIIRNFDERTVLDAIETERLTGGWMAPVMVSRLLEYKQEKAYDLDSFLWSIAGGERTQEKRIRDFGKLFKNGRYVDAYGLTETCGGDSFMEAGREIEKIGSAGRALLHVEIQIFNEQGQQQKAGEEGEICLRGPKITKGYWKEPEKTQKSFFGHWFRTGDIGWLDDEGFLYLTDRKKDMIISGGENIASSEVERVIGAMPEVQEVAVIGLPDQKWGECVAAVVVLQTNHTLELPRLVDYCREHMAGFKVPKKLFVRNDLPRNPSGKVLKRVLRQEMENMP